MEVKARACRPWDIEVLSLQLLIAAVATGAIYALIATGLNLIYGTMRLLNVAHGDIAMIGAYATYWALTLFGVSPIISIFAVILVLAMIGWGAYDLLFRRVLKGGKSGDRAEANSLLVFFGISILLENATAFFFGGSARAYQYADTILHFGDATILASRLIALIASIVACAGILVFFRVTHVGLAVRAIIQSRDAAQLVGVDVDRIYRLSFSLGFGLAGLAGALISLYSQIWPFMGFSFTIVAFVVVILGGLGNIFGGLVSALLFGILETFGVAWVGANYRSLLVYGAFIAVLIVRPQGLLGARGTAK
jgi:branched-chain amino acid transport system permease protein